MVIAVQDLFNMNKFNTKHDSKTSEGILVKRVRLNTQEGEFKTAPFQEKQERLNQEHSGHWPWAKGGMTLPETERTERRQHVACLASLLPAFGNSPNFLFGDHFCPFYVVLVEKPIRVVGIRPKGS